MLKRYSLQRQLIIIFGLFAIAVVIILVPLINKNLTELIDKQMYETLEMAQNRYIYYDYVPIESTTTKQIYHMKYYPNEETLVHSSNMSNSDAKALYNVFAKDLARMINSNKSTLHDKGTDLGGETIYYLITENSDIYFISLVYSDYSTDLVSGVQQQIINIMYIALAIVGIVIFVWVSSLIKPLRQITKYIENISKDKDSENTRVRDLSQDKSNGHAAKKRSRIPVFSAIFPEAGPQSGEIPPAAAPHAVVGPRPASPTTRSRPPPG